MFIPILRTYVVTSEPGGCAPLPLSGFPPRSRLALGHVRSARPWIPVWRATSCRYRRQLTPKRPLEQRLGTSMGELRREEAQRWGGGWPCTDAVVGARPPTLGTRSLDQLASLRLHFLISTITLARCTLIPAVYTRVARTGRDCLPMASSVSPLVPTTASLPSHAPPELQKNSQPERRPCPRPRIKMPCPCAPQSAS